MKKPLITVAGLVLAANLFAGPAEDIAIKHAKATAVELEAYLKDNPKAADKADAVEHLLSAYGIAENKKRIAELMQVKFDDIKAGDFNPQDLYSTTQMLFTALVDSGDKEGAKKVIATAIAKSEGHQAQKQLVQAFSQMEGQLNLPDVGDVMEIKFESTEGEDIDLAAMKGKVVLVDFWATWCGPCIAELPNVQETYDKYHEKGFEIIGISLDQDKEKLTKFVEDKKLPWAQYFDGKGWGNEISTGFGITGIPATFLIGKDGKVAATNLRGGALEKAVAEQIGKE